MRRVLIAVVCMGMLSALSARVARADVIEEGLYHLYMAGDDRIMVQVLEKVYNQAQTLDMTQIANAHLYTYTVINDHFTDANLGVWCWGFMEHPSTWGATVLGWASPTGWAAPWNCGCLAGTQAGWTGTALPNNSPRSHPQDFIKKGGSLNEFWLVAREGPYKPDGVTVNTVDAFAHGGPNHGSCVGITGPAYGKISAPTPEPVTLALLALGLPVGILARRRKKD